MRLRISHTTRYRYDAAPGAVIQTLRLTPRDHDGQYVASWRIDVSADCRLRARDDAFGNVVHTFTADGPFTELAVSVDGEVETQDTQGVVRGTVERFPPTLFLRDTSLTHADAAIRAFAATAHEAAGDDVLAVLHALLARLHAGMVYDPASTRTVTTAAEALALGRGVCQDLAHVFIAAARSLGVPARYVGGYFCRTDGLLDQAAGHAWVEAFVPALGWVAFDPANGICATDAHVRVAVGLDYLGAAPVRGSRYGGGAETLAVSIRVAQAATQVQS